MSNTGEELKKFDNDTLMAMLKKMLLIRRFEEKAAQVYGLRKIGGFCHLYIGQEAIAVGSVAAVDLSNDYIITAYRDHGHAIAVGMDPNVIMAELYGKKTGCSKGKGGSMHMFDKTKNFYGGHGIVGAHIPLAAGMALKVNYKNETAAVLCFFGDGAIHQGSFHETLNMASVYKLPVVFICENNQYGMGTDYRRVSAVHDFSKMAGSYNIPGRQVNGMEVTEVYHNVKQAADLARAEKTPTLLEIKTYRYMGHSMSDPAKYRTKEELENQKLQDPILIFKKKLYQAQMLTEDEFDKLDAEQKQTVKNAIEFAEQSEEPELSSLYQDVTV